MKLTRLELTGFKSFADTVTLSFEEGVTAIVGPNGCGKSNISDAVRWVLGEQSARLLRGGKMEDVIFQGAATRRPVNVTEVSLYLDNSDGMLPTPYTEVAITRRLSRSGQSDYLLNNTPARLRDIQDLLRGTGLGSDAGVVIEAKMIDALLSDRPDDRRELFEEAAGVGLYRDRRRTTARRLEETTVDLSRLDDLISEVQSQVRSLARQRKKAERHGELMARRFVAEITLVSREMEAWHEELASLELQVTSLRETLPTAEQRVHDVERRREEAYGARTIAEAERTELARLVSEQRSNAMMLESELKVAEERQRNALARRERADADATLEASNERERELEIEATGVAARLEALTETVRRDLGVDVGAIIGAERPALDESTSPGQRAEELAQRLGDLGPINPLALEELTVLEERHRDLDAQVADVRSARRELQEVVRTLDEEIMSTFASAAADVNEHFSDLVGTLFPGGQGRLTLTDPDDLLHTGVEIEVRPAGRNVRRVSLLSGGERSLAALAFLFAVFRSRPSPFYLMDEVEAALDDVNLHRFLGLVDEFRDEAQLVIVSHQKRTMEAADALYGVTMAPGGSSQVVSQKVERTTSVTA